MPVAVNVNAALFELDHDALIVPIAKLETALNALLYAVTELETKDEGTVVLVVTGKFIHANPFVGP
jgi:hypothetical protein